MTQGPSPAELLLGLAQVEAELGDELRKRVPDNHNRYTGQDFLLYLINLRRVLGIVGNFDTYRVWRDDFFKRVQEERERDRLS